MPCVRQKSTVEVYALWLKRGLDNLPLESQASIL